MWCYRHPRPSAYICIHEVMADADLGWPGPHWAFYNVLVLYSSLLPAYTILLLQCVTSRTKRRSSARNDAPTAQGTALSSLPPAQACARTASVAPLHRPPCVHTVTYTVHSGLHTRDSLTSNPQVKPHCHHTIHVLPLSVYRQLSFGLPLALQPLSLASPSLWGEPAAAA